MIEIPEAQTLAKQSNQFLTGRTMTKVEANHTPVSYTHLDVYKRQRLNDVGRILVFVLEVNIEGSSKYFAGLAL